MSKDNFPEFYRLCAALSLPPEEVIYHYAESLNLFWYILSPAGSHHALAAEIFNHFRHSGHHKVQRSEEKRLRLIGQVRSVIRIIRTSGTTEQKEEKAAMLASQWFEQFHETKQLNLHLGNERRFPLPREFFLVCDIFSASPADVIRHFMASFSALSDINQPACRFLWHCAAILHDSEMN